MQACNCNSHGVLKYSHQMLTVLASHPETKLHLPVPRCESFPHVCIAFLSPKPHANPDDIETTADWALEHQSSAAPTADMASEVAGSKQTTLTGRSATAEGSRCIYEAVLTQRCIKYTPLASLFDRLPVRGAIPGHPNVLVADLWPAVFLCMSSRILKKCHVMHDDIALRCDPRGRRPSSRNAEHKVAFMHQSCNLDSFDLTVAKS